nr:hypothetical protein [Lachnospiraceae bacterium]
MEKGNNKKLYIIIGLLVVLALCLVIVLGALFVGAEKETEGQNPESSLLGEEVKQEQTNGSGIAIVTGGFKVVIPEDYGCFYAEGIGPVIYMDDVFQMKLKVIDGTYEEAAANPDKLMSGTTDAGGTILQEVKEKEIDRKKYLYYIMELADQECYVVYTQAADSEKRIAGQIAIESGNVTEEDILQMFAEIVGSAVETDEADTDEAALDEMKAAANRGEVKTESTLSLTDCSVTFRVPEGYYGQGQFALDDTVSEYFLSEDYAIEATVGIHIPEDDGYETAEQYTALMFDWMSEDVQKDFSVQEMQVEGTTYYYYNVSYEDEGHTYKEMFFAADVENGGIYSVKAEATDESVVLTEEAVKEFLVLD